MKELRHQLYMWLVVDRRNRRRYMRQVRAAIAEHKRTKDS